MKKKVQTFLIFLQIFIIALASTNAFAVNFYDGARAQGNYFLSYTSVYLADETTDSSGKKNKDSYNLTKAEELLRWCYYKGDFVASALVPVDYMSVGSLNQESSGLGDISLGTGYFLPFKKIDILPMLFVKFPTGEYNADKAVNIGTNQYDIRPVIFLYKSLGKFSIDAAAKYFIRLKNPATNVLPGDEFHLQGLFGYNVTDRFKIGPSINWMISRDREVNGTKVPDSARESLSVGADIYYRFSKVSVTATYLYDAYAENLPKGHFFQLKAVYRF
ncbi:MAG: transporter [Smithella sp.]